MQAARTPVVLGDRRKEGLEQPCDVPAFGTRRALLLMPHSSPVIGYERVVKDAACWANSIKGWWVNTNNVLVKLSDVRIKPIILLSVFSTQSLLSYPIFADYLYLSQSSTIIFHSVALNKNLERKIEIYCDGISWLCCHHGV